MAAREWISTDDVAELLGYTTRQAWDLVKRLGVPTVGPFRSRSKMARFRRADFMVALEASMRSPAPEPEPEEPTPPARSPRRPAGRPAGDDGDDPLNAWKAALARREALAAGRGTPPR